MNKLLQNQQGDQQTALNFVAAIVTLLSCVMSVQFSTERYDIWDGFLAGLAIYVCHHFRDTFANDARSLFLARVSLGVACMILVMTAAYAVEPFWPQVTSLDHAKLSIFDAEFGMSVAFFCVSLFVYKRDEGPTAA